MDDDESIQKVGCTFGRGELERQTDGVLQLSRLDIYCTKTIRMLNM